MATGYEWDDITKRIKLSEAFGPKVRHRLSTVDLQLENRNDDLFPQVIQRVEALFVTANDTEEAHNAWDRAAQGPDESMRDWHSRLHRLYQQAYPHAALVGDRLADIQRKFLKGIYGACTEHFSVY